MCIPNEMYSDKKETADPARAINGFPALFRYERAKRRKLFSNNGRQSMRVTSLLL